MRIKVIQNIIDVLRGKNNSTFIRELFFLPNYLYNNFITYIPFWNLRLFYLRKILKYNISKSCFIHMGCRLSGNISIGEDTVIGRNCDIIGNVKIGAHSSISAYNIIQSVSHVKNSPYFSAFDIPIVIEDYVWTGYRTIIMTGAHIKQGCIIGVNSYVTGKTQMEECDVLAGSPARKISTRDKEALKYMLNYHPMFS